MKNLINVFGMFSVLLILCSLEAKADNYDCKKIQPTAEEKIHLANGSTYYREIKIDGMNVGRESRHDFHPGGLGNKLPTNFLEDEADYICQKLGHRGSDSRYLTYRRVFIKPVSYFRIWAFDSNRIECNVLKLEKQSAEDRVMDSITKVHKEFYALNEIVCD